MKISFSPIRSDEQLNMFLDAEILTINGTPYDFSALAEGEVLTQDSLGCDWLASDVTRVNGEVELTLILPHVADAPHQILFPAPIEQVQDGEIRVPTDL